MFNPNLYKCLNAEQLVKLLRELVIAETATFGGDLAGISVTQYITIPDGGEDGLVQWEHDLPKGMADTFIPHKFTLFQCKASDKTNWKSEVLDAKGNVKARVKEVLESGGFYVAFTTNPAMDVKQNSDKSVSDILQGLKDGGLDAKLLQKIKDENRVKFITTNQIDTWTQKYPSLYYQIAHILGAPSQILFTPFDLWHQKMHSLGDLTLIYDDTTHQRKAKQDQVVNLLAEGGASIRIEGDPGVGKSRFVYEVINSQDALKVLTLYFDRPNIDDLRRFVHQVNTSKKRAIIILDNTDSDIHRSIEQEVATSEGRLSLVSIGSYKEGVRFENHIELSPDKDLVYKLLLQFKFTEKEAEELCDEIDGYPLIASWLNNAETVNKIKTGAGFKHDFPQRLLEARCSEEHTAEHKKVMKALSSFYAINTSEKSKQLDWIYQNLLKGMPSSSFEKILDELKKVGITTQVGDYLMVKPRPISLFFCQLWWEDYARNVDIIKEYFTESDMPDELSASMCRQLEKLEYFSKGKELFAKFCGAGSPFVRAEVLFTDWGSRLFRSIANIAPESVAEVYHNALHELTLDEVKSINGSVRRNIVWMLEELYWHKDTFKQSVEMGYLLAECENESWSNNATGNLIGKFYLQLSGTVTSLIDRIEMMKSLIENAHTDERKEIVISVLGACLHNGTFSRSGTRHDSSEDYTPSTWEEIFTYWDFALTELSKIIAKADSGSNLQKNGLDELFRRVHSLISSNYPIDNIYKTFEFLVDKVPNVVPQINQTVRNIGKRDFKEAYDALSKLINKKTSSIEDEITLLVKEPPLHNMKKVKGEYVDISTLEAEAFAEKLHKQNESLEPYAKLLISGELRQGYSFAKKYASKTTEDELKQLVNVLLDLCSSMPENDINIDFLGGLVSTMRKDGMDVNYVLDFFQHTRKEISTTYTLLALMQEVRKDDLIRVFDMIKELDMSLDYLVNYSYGSRLKDYDCDHLIELCTSIIEIKPEKVAYVLKFASFAFGKRESEAIASLLIDMLFHEDILTSLHSCKRDLKSHIYTTTLQKILAENNDLETKVSNLCQSLILFALAKSPSTEGIDYDFDKKDLVSEIINTLFESPYKETVWNIIAEACLDLQKDEGPYNHLYFVLGHNMDGHPRFGSLSDKIPQEILLKFLEQKGLEAAKMLAWALPAIKLNDEGVYDWHPVIYEMFIWYGNDDIVQRLLQSNMHSFSSVGSRAPYYERYIAPLKKLLKAKDGEVVKWAKQQIVWFKEEIQRSEKEDAHRKAGISIY